MDWMTVAEAAAFANVSQGTIRAWIAAGRIHSIKLGPRLTRVSRSSLEALAVTT